MDMTMTSLFIDSFTLKHSYIHLLICSTICLKKSIKFHDSYYPYKHTFLFSCLALNQSLIWSIIRSWQVFGSRTKTPPFCPNLSWENPTMEKGMRRDKPKEKKIRNRRFFPLATTSLMIMIGLMTWQKGCSSKWRHPNRLATFAPPCVWTGRHSSLSLSPSTRRCDSNDRKASNDESQLRLTSDHLHWKDGTWPASLPLYRLLPLESRSI